MSSSGKRQYSDISQTGRHYDDSEICEDSDGSELSDDNERSNKDNDSRKDEEEEICSHCGSPKKCAKGNYESEAEPTINKMNDSSDEEEDNVKVCRICGGTPCQWIDYGGDEILKSLQSKYDVTTAKDGYVLQFVQQ